MRSLVGYSPWGRVHFPRTCLCVPSCSSHAWLTAALWTKLFSAFHLFLSNYHILRELCKVQSDQFTPFFKKVPLIYSHHLEGKVRFPSRDTQFFSWAGFCLSLHAPSLRTLSSRFSHTQMMTSQGYKVTPFVFVGCSPLSIPGLLNKSFLHLENVYSACKSQNRLRKRAFQEVILNLPHQFGPQKSQ